MSDCVLPVCRVETLYCRQGFEKIALIGQIDQFRDEAEKIGELFCRE